MEGTRRRLLADLAHEMRTPLATVEAHLEAVEDGVRDLDATTLAVIRSSTGRFRRLAEDISAVSRAEEGKLQIHRRTVNAAAVARTALAAAHDRRREGGRPVRDPGSGVGVADPDRIGQVLANLLDNALRHTPSGATVRLSCHEVDHHLVEYTVADSGDGIAAEHLTHVFDRFSRADTARDRGRGGSGIGLSIARALVEAHRGRSPLTALGLATARRLSCGCPPQRRALPEPLSLSADGCENAIAGVLAVATGLGARAAVLVHLGVLRALVAAGLAGLGTRLQDRPRDVGVVPGVPGQHPPGRLAHVGALQVAGMRSVSSATISSDSTRRRRRCTLGRIGHRQLCTRRERRGQGRWWPPCSPTFV